MRVANVLFMLTLSIAQDMQIKYVTAYTIDVDWGGEIETVSEITAAPGYAKFNGKLNPKRWIFRLFGGERGLISYFDKKNNYEKLIEEEKVLTAKLKDLDHKISLINKNDPDYLDMLYRQKFNYVTENEINSEIIFFNHKTNFKKFH